MSFPDRMKFLAIFVLLIAGAVWNQVAHAQVVMACSEAWGSSDSCGGCNGLQWKTPAPTLKVKTTASDFYTLLSSLKATDTVFTAAGKNDGDPAKCSEAVAIKVSDLGGTTPIPPTPAPQPTTIGDEVVNWTACQFNTDKSPCVPTGYHLRWSGPQSGEVKVGNVLTYTIKSLPAGSYFVTIATMDASGEGDQSNAAKFTIAGTTPTPPPTPTPQPNYTVTPGIYTPKKGNSNISGAPTFANHDDCTAYLGKQPSGVYNCGYSGEKVTVK